MKEKYSRPSIVNTETLELERAFTSAITKVAAVLSAKLFNSILQTDQGRKILAATMAGKPLHTHLGLKKFRRLNFENNEEVLT